MTVGIAGIAVVAAVFKKLAFFMKGNVSPADVLTKTNDKEDQK